MIIAYAPRSILESTRRLLVHFIRKNGEVNATAQYLIIVNEQYVKKQSDRFLGHFISDCI